ncbi:MAG: 16S rRNA (cytidine(1402)-2'-O)-methyltransferase [Firmicutes bacterium]|jgi:16S rRNA (cytidine1402-2'-O)-methyltransferase|nr:16S rRNA (cytidine(1402)-2'-O)-methyltransferase [Bacillota bacterium]
MSKIAGNGHGILYLCATPIGNLADITIRALDILREVEIIVCEDTRRTSKLLHHYGIKPHKLISYHQHSPPERVDYILRFLEKGKDLAMVTDAGMPGLSDPGSELVSHAWKNGFEVTVLPGPSMVTAALAISGMPADSFVFLGFLNRFSPGQRKEILGKLRCSKVTIVIFEAPHRIMETLQELEEIFGEACEIAMVRELSKKFEEVTRGTPGEHLRRFQKKEPRGELTMVLAPDPPGKEQAADQKLYDDLVTLARAGIPPGFAVKAVSLLRKEPRNRVYKLQLKLKKER